MKKSKTAEEILLETFNTHNNNPNNKLGIVEIEIEAMRAYARQVAKAVRDECAKQATIIQTDTEYNSRTGDRDPIYDVDRSSIESINIDDYLK